MCIKGSCPQLPQTNNTVNAHMKSVRRKLLSDYLERREHCVSQLLKVSETNKLTCVPQYECESQHSSTMVIFSWVHVWKSVKVNTTTKCVYWSCGVLLHMRNTVCTVYIYLHKSFRASKRTIKEATESLNCWQPSCILGNVGASFWQQCYRSSMLNTSCTVRCILVLSMCRTLCALVPVVWV